MNILKNEMRQGLKGLLLWGLIIGGTIVLCVALFPDLKKEFGDMVDAMADMGGFGAAFGMNQLNYGEITGFYGIYAGSMLGIGGIFFAAVLGTGILAKEEKEHTAEFLLTHPVTRTSAFFQKLAAMLVQILLMNGIVILLAVLSFQLIGETPEWKGVWLFHIAQLLMQTEIACICMGISAFLRKGSVSIGIGVAALLYFLGLFGNITEEAEKVKYITPYAYADAADILPDAALDGTLILLGMGYAFLGLAIGYVKYQRNDIY